MSNKQLIFAICIYIIVLTIYTYGIAFVCHAQETTDREQVEVILGGKSNMEFITMESTENIRIFTDSNGHYIIEFDCPCEE